MNFFSKYKYGLLVGLLLTLFFSAYTALDWRDQTVCIGTYSSHLERPVSIS